MSTGDGSPVVLPTLVSGETQFTDAQPLEDSPLQNSFSLSHSPGSTQFIDVEAFTDTQHEFHSEGSTQNKYEDPAHALVAEIVGSVMKNTVPSEFARDYYLAEIPNDDAPFTEEEFSNSQSVAHVDIPIYVFDVADGLSPEVVQEYTRSIRIMAEVCRTMGNSLAAAIYHHRKELRDQATDVCGQRCLPTVGFAGQQIHITTVVALTTSSTAMAIIRCPLPIWGN